MAKTMYDAVTARFNTTGATATSDGGTTTGAMANTDTIYTVPVDIRDFEAAALQFIWASGTSPVGTLTAEFSLDGTTWTDSGLTFTAISGASGSRLLNITARGGIVFARFKYVNTSGTATATGKFRGAEA